MLTENIKLSYNALTIHILAENVDKIEVQIGQCRSVLPFY